MWATFSVKLVSLLAKFAPFLLAALAYMKGKAAAYEEQSIENLKLEKEYETIRADKSGTIDDDLKRMQDGTF